MDKPTLSFGELERTFDLVAQAVDEVGPEQESLLLSKLALTLAHQLGDYDKGAQAVAIAKRDLARPE